MAILSAMVALFVNATLEAPGAPSKFATAARARYTAIPAAIDAGCTPRPTPPNDVMASATARTTHSGFVIVVAALSK